MAGTSFLRALAIIAAVAAPVAAADTPIKLGVFGDSISDEYAEEAYGYAANWFEQLDAAGVIDAGPTAVEAKQPGGTWGEPRRGGFQYNWARAGAATFDAIHARMHSSLADTIRDHGITHAVILIGANNFAPGDENYERLYHGMADEAAAGEMIDTAVGDIEAALRAVRSTGAKVVVATVPDYAVAPITRHYFTDPQRRENVTKVIRRINERIRELATGQGVPVVDLFRLTKTVFGENDAPKSRLRLGDVALQIDEMDTPDHANPTAGFVHDGIHPHTAIQGALANVILEAFNRGYGDDLPLFSEEEILARAGLSYGGRDTLMAEIGASGYDDFLVLSEQHASAGPSEPGGESQSSSYPWLLGAGVVLAALGLIIFRRRRQA